MIGKSDNQTPYLMHKSRRVALHGIPGLATLKDAVISGSQILINIWDNLTGFTAGLAKSRVRFYNIYII